VFSFYDKYLLALPICLLKKGKANNKLDEATVLEQP
jgi:hypothetical protein